MVNAISHLAKSNLLRFFDSHEISYISKTKVSNYSQGLTQSMSALLTVYHRPDR